MQPIDNKTLNFEQYVQYIDTTCYRMIVRNSTACSHFSDIMAHKLQQIRHTRQLLADVVRRECETSRSRRGLFNFVGTVSRALFGTMDDDDARFYHDQIERFEQCTTTITQLVKHQLIIAKSAWGYV